MAVLEYDARLIDDLASRFSLRDPNTRGLRKAIMELSVQEYPEQIVLDMATGVGKTYLLAALLEFAAAQGVKNLLVVMPGKTVRTKTIANFTPGADGFITGAEVTKVVITPDNFADSGAVLADTNAVKLFLLNVHHLVQQDVEEFAKPGSAKAKKLRTARPQETLGESLLDYLAGADDLFMILDESHSYTESAKTWEAALTALAPAARVGLTATPVATDNVVFRYGLRDAITQGFVKQPVVAMRRDGYPDNEEVGRLTDAKALLLKKAIEYHNYEIANPEVQRVNPIMLVSCRDITHADEIAGILRRPELFGDDGAVLVIHSEAMTSELEIDLARVQRLESPVRAIVQVDMLSEGWDVHNVAVLVPLRALASGTLTEQMIGRGLRMPYGRPTGNEWVDSLDVISHESINAALRAHGLGGRRALHDLVTSAVVPGSTGPDVPILPPESLNSSNEEIQLSWAAGGEATLPLSDGSVFGDGSVVDTVAALGGRARDLGDDVLEAPTPPEPVFVTRRNATDFIFPSSTIEVTTRRLQFSDLGTEWLTRVASEVGASTAAAIDREAIVIGDDGSKITLRPTTEAEIDEAPLSESAAVDHVSRRLRQTKVLMNGPEGLENLKRTDALSKRFVTAVGGQWTPKRAEVAARKLVAETRREAEKVARDGAAVPKVYPLKLPKRDRIELPGGTKVLSHTEATPATFSVTQFYNDWNRGMYDATNFDAYATEMLIARLLDKSAMVEWWTRLFPSDGARIEYGLGHSYHPDFVACDTDGVHWIIEGKAEKGRDDDVVQAKRKAAVRVLREMEGLDEWRDTRWGYLIAYQDEVRVAQSWADLRAWSSPERMV